MEQTNHSSDGSMPGSTQSSAQGATQEQSQGQAAASDSAHGIADRARDIAGNAQDKLADVGSTVRDRAGHLKSTLADALDTGADKLRARGTTNSSSAQLAGAAGSTNVAVDGNNRVGEMSDRVADGMEATADWLRDADLDGLKASVERQVKDHPGRTLLIAAGLGYLIGKALKK